MHRAIGSHLRCAPRACAVKDGKPSKRGVGFLRRDSRRVEFGGRKRSERQEVEMLKLSQKVSVAMKGAAVAGAIATAGIAFSAVPAAAQHHGGGGGGWHGGGGARGA